MGTLKRTLYETDPFEGAADIVADVPPDLTGWGSTHPMLAAVITAVRPQRVIEVGSWKGGSAIHLAETMNSLGLEGEIVCVDTWLGAPIAWTTERHLQPSLRLRAGYPQLYYTFVRNVMDAGVSERIVPLPASSDGGHQVLAFHKVVADVIYIDADHEYAAVKRDIQNYFALLDHDGVMICDDFGCWPGVTRAVKEFAEENDLYAVKQREKVALSRRELAQRCALKPDGHYDRRAAA